MPYCVNCGSEVPTGGRYCPNCGTAVTLNPPPSPPQPPPASSSSSSSSSWQSADNELNNLARDKNAQEHWFLRLVAFIIDVIIVGIAVYILELIVALAFVGPALVGGFVGVPFALFGLGLAGVLGSLALVFYFTFAEWLYGRSIGKGFLHLRVVAVDGSKLDFGKAFTRNISKIFWLLLILDILGGLIAKTRRGQKYSDYIANTNVIKAD
jgi:uncharacterized RDD family membrane protein YckC